MGIQTESKKDAIIVNAEEVKSRAGKDYFIEIKIPKKEGEEGSAQKKIVSEIVAEEVLKSIGSQHLIKNLQSECK